MLPVKSCRFDYRAKVFLEFWYNLRLQIFDPLMPTLKQKRKWEFKFTFYGIALMPHKKKLAGDSIAL